MEGAQANTRRVSLEQWEVVGNEVVVVSACSPLGEPVILMPEGGVGFPSVLRDVRRWSVLHQEHRVADAHAVNAWPRCIRARALALYTAVISSRTMAIAMAGIPTRILWMSMVWRASCALPRQPQIGTWEDPCPRVILIRWRHHCDAEVLTGFLLMWLMRCAFYLLGHRSLKQRADLVMGVATL